jgi:hypothetical protein
MTFAVHSKAPRYMFGVEIPGDVQHALQLDRQYGNKLWLDSVNTELSQLSDYHTFLLPDGTFNRSGYKQVQCHTVFVCKHYGRRKSRLVANPI